MDDSVFLKENRCSGQTLNTRTLISSLQANRLEASYNLRTKSSLRSFSKPPSFWEPLGWLLLGCVSTWVSQGGAVGGGRVPPRLWPCAAGSAQRLNLILGVRTKGEKNLYNQSLWWMNLCFPPNLYAELLTPWGLRM